jgi:hypothetical protein
VAGVEVASCKGLSVGTHSVHSGSCKVAGSTVRGCRQQVALARLRAARLQAAGCRL